MSHNEKKVAKISISLDLLLKVLTSSNGQNCSCLFFTFDNRTFVETADIYIYIYIYICVCVCARACVCMCVGLTGSELEHRSLLSEFEFRRWLI